MPSTAFTVSVTGPSGRLEMSRVSDTADVGPVWTMVTWPMDTVTEAITTADWTDAWTATESGTPVPTPGAASMTTGAAAAKVDHPSSTVTVTQDTSLI